ncbi:MAG: MFS transporter [Chloroflexi bacterium]|nr:MFS transporter [Chloroflexota bacterium]
MTTLSTHPLISTLKNLRGNARGCVFTEPLWGIPYNLYFPYVSVYMLALGLSDSQIGLITSVGLACQVFWTLLSGAITDKLGRKRTTLIFDIISWSVPCLIWAIAQDVNYFFAAAIVNSIWRVTMNSWTCLLVEETEPRLLLDVYSWIYIGGLIAAFVSPITGLLIGQFSLVPTMRGLYVLSFVLMTAKFVIMNGMVHETRRGVERMKETAKEPLFAVLRGSRAVLWQILHTPATLFTAGLMVLLNICWLVKGTFWSVLVTEKLQIPAQDLVIFTFARSVIMLLFYFLIMPRLGQMDVRKPLMWGLLGLVISQVLLISVPAGDYVMLMVATVLEACCTPLATTLLDKLAAIMVDPKERARIMAILYVVMIVFTSPFGWIAGELSELNRSLPFILNIALFAVAGVLTLVAGRLVASGVLSDAAAEPAAESTVPTIEEIG